MLSRIGGGRCGGRGGGGAGGPLSGEGVGHQPGAGCGARRRGDGSGDTAGQGQNRPGLQLCRRLQRVMAGQLVRAQPDAGGDAGHGVALACHGDLIVREGDYPPRIGGGTRRGGGSGLGGAERSGHPAAKIGIEPAIGAAGCQKDHQRAGRDIWPPPPPEDTAPGDAASGRAGPNNAVPENTAHTIVLMNMPGMGVMSVPTPRPAARSAPVATRHSRSRFRIE